VLNVLAQGDIGTKRLSDLSKPNSLLVARPELELMVLIPGPEFSILLLCFEFQHFICC
jgi:hypothetical protein